MPTPFNRGAKDPPYLTATEIANDDTFGFGHTSLDTWSNEGCPALGGRKLRTQRRRVPDILGRVRLRRVFSRKNLNSIFEFQKGQDAKLHNGRTFLTPREVSTELQFDFDRVVLLRWHNHGCGLLGGRKLKSKLVRRPDTLGRARWIRSYSRRQLKEICDALTMLDTGAVPKKLSRWMRFREVMDDARVNFSSGALYCWARVGCPYLLLNQKLHSIRIPTLHRGGRKRPRMVFLRAHIEQIFAARKLDAEEWRTAAQVAGDRSYGFKAATLSAWAHRGCAWLDGEKLHPERVSAPNAIGTVKMLNVYYVPQLNQIKAAMAIAEMRSLVPSGDDPSTWPNQRQVANDSRFGFFGTFLYEWCNRGCRALDGEKLRSELVHRVNATGRLRLARVYCPENLTRIAEFIRTTGTPQQKLGLAVAQNDPTSANVQVVAPRAPQPSPTGDVHAPPASDEPTNGRAQAAAPPSPQPSPSGHADTPPVTPPTSDGPANGHQHTPPPPDSTPRIENATARRTEKRNLNWLQKAKELEKDGHPNVCAQIRDWWNRLDRTARLTFGDGQLIAPGKAGSQKVRAALRSVGWRPLGDGQEL